MKVIDQTMTEFTAEDFLTIPGLKMMKENCELVMAQFERGNHLKRINGNPVVDVEILGEGKLVTIEVENTRKQTVRFTWIVNDEFPAEYPYMMLYKDILVEMPQQDFWSCLPLT